MNDNYLIRAFIAEFLGTFTLVFIGSGSVVVAPVFGLLVPAFAHGLIVLGLIYTYGNLSGAHFNPAVTVALLVGRQIEPLKAVLYIVIQFIAGIVAAYLLLFSVGGAENPALLEFLNGAEFNYGETVGFLTNDYVWQAAFIEAILVFILVSAIFQSAVHSKIPNFAGIAIGLTLAACILAGGPLTGASINPARSLGPALAAGNLSYILPYCVGLFIGGAVGGAVNTYLLAPTNELKTEN